MGHAGVGWGRLCRGRGEWVMQGWGWVMYEQGWVGYVGVEWGRLCRGGVHHTEMKWAAKFSLNNLMFHKLGVLSFLLKNYCQLFPG